MKGGWRRLIPILAMAVLVGAGAKAATPVESFVQQNIDRGIAVLKDKNLDDATRRKQLADFMAQILDTKKMALFMIGDVRDKAAPPDLDTYAEIYKAFTIASYESELGGYGGQSLKVTDSIERAPGDYIVNAVVVDPSAPKDPNPLQVAFRVTDEGGGKYAVVDASIEGIWLGLAQRAEFGSYLSQHDESIPALTTHLQDVTAQLSGTGATASTR